MTTVNVLHHRRRTDTWIKVTVTRSHTRLRPAVREQGTTTWGHEGVTKYLVRRWHAEAGKWRLLVQVKPPMTRAEEAAWVSPSHLAQSRRFS